MLCYPAHRHTLVLAECKRHIKFSLKAPKPFWIPFLAKTPTLIRHAIRSACLCMEPQHLGLEPLAVSFLLIVRAAELPRRVRRSGQTLLATDVPFAGTA